MLCRVRPPPSSAGGAGAGAGGAGGGGPDGSWEDDATAVCLRVDRPIDTTTGVIESQSVSMFPVITHSNEVKRTKTWTFPVVFPHDVTQSRVFEEVSRPVAAHQNSKWLILFLFL